jgi:hypothetical protein
MFTAAQGGWAAALDYKKGLPRNIISMPCRIQFEWHMIHLTSVTMVSSAHEYDSKFIIFEDLKDDILFDFF